MDINILIELINSLNSAIIVLELTNTKIYYFNTKFSQIFSKNIIAQLEELLKNSKYKPTEQIVNSTFRKLLSNQPQQFKTEYNGKTYESSSLRLQSESGNYVVLKFLDITLITNKEKSLSEANTRLSELIENLQEGILVEDEYRRIVRVNSEFCNMFKIPADPVQMLGMDCSRSAEQSKYLFKEPEKFVSRIDEILLKKEAVRNEELETADGKFYERDYLPIFILDNYKGHFWHYRDITYRVKHEEELKNSKNSAEESRKAKESFLAHISHEIRTPMNAVQGFTSLLMKMNPTEEQMKFLDAIKSSSENLLIIINDLLDFSKIDAGKLDFSNSDFSFRDLIKNTIKVVSYQAEENKTKLIEETDPDIPNYVFGDEVRIGQILLNLVSNAVKFTENGEVSIISKLVNEDENRLNIEFIIKDTGIGIPEESLSRIFNSFEQVNNKRQIAGTGLGLAIVKRLTELMNGDVSVTSEVDKGTEFKLLLPIGKSNQDEEKIELKNTLTEEDYDIPKGVKVLIVEDNKLNQMLAVSILKQQKIDYDIAVNGREAIEKLNRGKYDIVFMDLSMPVMDGYEAARVIRRELYNEVPIVALTATTLSDTKNKVLKAGMNDYLPKPFNQSNMLEKISKNLKSRSQKLSSASQDLHSVKIDLEYLNKLSDGDDDFLRDIANTFLELLDEETLKLEIAIFNCNYKNIKASVHKMKPNFAYFGVHQGYELCEKIEYECDKSHDKKALEKLIKTLNEITYTTKERINRLILNN